MPDHIQFAEDLRVAKRIAVAAWPHWGTYICSRYTHMDEDEREQEIFQMAMEAMRHGWAWIGDEPVAPDGWDETYERLTHA